MVKALEQEESWLGGETVDHFLQMAAFSQPSFTTVTALMLKGERNKEENLTFAELFTDVRTGKSIGNCIVGVNVGNQHWAAVLIRLFPATAFIHDSTHISDSSRVLLAEVARNVDVLKTFLSDEARDILLEMIRGPLQQDSHNCGVFTVVTSFLLTTEIPLSKALDGAL